MRFENPKIVKINNSRWNVYIAIKDSEGVEHHFVASADSGVTYGDGIFFDTLEEYNEEISRL